MHNPFHSFRYVFEETKGLVKGEKGNVPFSILFFLPPDGGVWISEFSSLLSKVERGEHYGFHPFDAMCTQIGEGGTFLRAYLLIVLKERIVLLSMLIF